MSTENKTEEDGPLIEDVDPSKNDVSSKNNKNNETLNSVEGKNTEESSIKAHQNTSNFSENSKEPKKEAQQSTNVSSEESNYPSYSYSILNCTTLGLILIVCIFGSLFELVVFLNFNVDHPVYNLDFMNITRAGKNKVFSLCGVYSCIDNWYFSFFMNIAILFIIHVQEVVLNSKYIRRTFVKRAGNYLFYYPKYIFHLVNTFLRIMLHMLYQPMHYDKLSIYPQLDLREYFHPIFLVIPGVVGLYFIFTSLIFNLVYNDELGIFLLIKLIKGDKISNFGDFMYGGSIYKIVRSPFRAGFLIILFCLNPLWDLGRALYVFFFSLNMYIQGVNDDRYYFEQYEIYREYVREVPDRFFNFKFLLGEMTGRRNKRQEEIKEEKNKGNEVESNRKKKRKKEKEN